MNLSRSCASRNSHSKAFLEPSECPSWDGAAAGGAQEGHPESPSILCCLEGLLIRIVLKKTRENILCSQEELAEGGRSQPPAPLQPLSLSRLERAGSALENRVQRDLGLIAGLDFGPVPWLGGQSGFLPPQAMLAIV